MNKLGLVSMVVAIGGTVVFRAWSDAPCDCCVLNDNNSPCISIGDQQNAGIDSCGFQDYYKADDELDCADLAEIPSYSPNGYPPAWFTPDCTAGDFNWQLVHKQAGNCSAAPVTDPPQDMGASCPAWDLDRTQPNCPQ